MANRVGQQLDNYRLTRLLGAGGFGEVYLAEHIYRTAQVAIKILPPLAQDDLHSFLTEARTFRLKHPNIVQVLDFGVEGRIPFIVMEYAPNDTLRKLHPKGTRVPLPTIVSYVKQVASALQYAHDERLVHRDVKPENMLIGGQNRVLLSDFGIATIAHGTASQSVETMAGTIPYMAPEQIQGHPRPASDQYSLSVVVYEWLCGDRPFHGTLTEVAVQHATAPPPPLQEKVPTISPEVEQVVMTALAKDPKKRFGSMLAFATALEQASQVKQSEPKLEPVVPVSETTDTNQSQQPTETATPVPGILLSQQVIVGEVPADTPAQPHTIIPLSGKERLRQAEEERRQAEEERARQKKEQADKLEEERVRKAKESEAAQKAEEEQARKAEEERVRKARQEPTPSRFPPSAGTRIPQGPRLRFLSWKAPALLLVMALLILGSGVGLYATMRISSARTQATATVNAQAGATANAFLTRTAQAYATATAQVVATATTSEQMYARATSGTPVLDNSLSNNSAVYPWYEGTDKIGTCVFRGGAYHNIEPKPGVYHTCGPGVSFRDFVFQVQMVIVKGDAGGIVFRWVSTHAYSFYISQEGSYELLIDFTRIKYGSSSAIKLGLNQSNLIAVSAQGNTIDLFVNRQYITSMNDSTYSEGIIGIGAHAISNPTEVEFHNAKVWIL